MHSDYSILTEEIETNPKARNLKLVITKYGSGLLSIRTYLAKVMLRDGQKKALQFIMS